MTLRTVIIELWRQNKVLNCDFYGWGMGAAMNYAQKMGLDAMALAFAPLVKKKGQRSFIDIYVSNTEMSPNEYPEEDRYNTVRRALRALKKVVAADEFDNIYVEFGYEVFGEGTEDRHHQLTCVVKGRVFNQYTLEWKENMQTVSYWEKKLVEMSEKNLKKKGK